MKIVLLDGDKIENVTMLHETFARELDFPEHYGKNLDALHDLLTESTQEIGVLAVNVDALEEHVGRRWKVFLRLMGETQQERPGFRFCLDPFGETVEKE